MPKTLSQMDDIDCMGQEKKVEKDSPALRIV